MMNHYKCARSGADDRKINSDAYQELESEYVQVQGAECIARLRVKHECEYM